MSVLARRWAADDRAAEAAAVAAGDELGRFLRETASGGVSLAEIERRSAAYRTLSAELRERRRRHGEAAAAVLTPGQQERLGRLHAGPEGGRR
jgi:hypothetical protein